MSNKKDDGSDALLKSSDSARRLSQAELDFRASELILKTSKEIAVKFIESGRLSPTTFDSAFQMIHVGVKDAFYSTFHKPAQEG